MGEAFLDRRRTPRVALADGERIGVPLALTVRLVDISGSGVLISSPQRMAIGQRARLRTTLGSKPLDVEVEVRRVSEPQAGEGAGRGRFRLGAVFVKPDDLARDSVHQFLRDDTP